MIPHLIDTGNEKRFPPVSRKEKQTDKPYGCHLHCSHNNGILRHQGNQGNNKRHKEGSQIHLSNRHYAGTQEHSSQYAGKDSKKG